MCRILVVDDDPKIRSTLAILLMRRGLGTAVQAADGVDALASLANRPADLIITDCQMPRMDGLSFVRTLRTHGETTPIVMLSGQGDPRVVEAAIRAGVTRYLAKPLNPATLIDTVRELSCVPSAAPVGLSLPAFAPQAA